MTAKRNMLGKSLIGCLLALTAVVALATTAEARTSFSLRVGVPLYAGPPAYYPAYPAYYPYYAPTYAPVYYAPPPVVVVPAPAAAAPSCRNGLWRQQDGSVVNGLACLQPNGVWRLAN